MERNNLFDRIDDLLKVQDYDSLLSLEEELQEYRKTCSETETGFCDIYLKNIEVVRSLKQVEQQQRKLVEFVKSWGKESIIKLEYIEPYGNSCGVTIFFDDYAMELVYKPVDIIEKNEIRTKFYLNANGVFKQFVLSRNIEKADFAFLNEFKGLYYAQKTTFASWGDDMIEDINAICEKLDNLTILCNKSCPFDKNGKHKYDFWETLAKVEVSYVENTSLIQGIKKGQTVSGAHVVGDNGSYRVWDKRTYVIKCTVDKMSCEKPVRHEYIYDLDAYFRDLKERLGYANMPYQKLNSLLENKIHVITHDMNKDPEARVFYPTEYNNDWIGFLNHVFERL